MKRRSRLLAASAVLLLATFGLAACGGDSEDASLKNVTVGYAYGYDVSHAGDQFGFDRLKNDGVAVKMIELGSPTDAIAALDTGQIDIANVGMSQTVPAVQQGAKIRLVLPANTLSEYLLVGGPKIKTVADLKGKTVMVSSLFGQTGTFVKNLLTQNGVSIDDVSMPELRDSSGRIVALRAGKADAALLDPLDVRRLQLEGEDVTVLGRLSEVQPRAPGNAWAVSNSLIKKNPAFVQKFVSAMLDGYDEAYSDNGRKRFISDAQAGTLKGESNKLAPAIYAWYRQIGFWPKRDEVFGQAGYGPIISYWEKNSVIDPNPPAFAKVWDTSFWENA